MPDSRLDLSTLLAPISTESPSGEDLRFSLDWKKLEDAKRADDDLGKGAWEPKEQKTADWALALRVGEDLLARKSKDVRIAVVLLEALTRLDGFAGASAGLELLEKLVEGYWSQGLYPLPDGDNLEDRAAAFDWINTKLPDLLRDVEITPRADGGPTYTYARFLDARAVGREKDFEEGRTSAEKRERFLKAKEEGRSLDLYEAAVAASQLPRLEELLAQVDRVLEDLKRLTRLLNEKFGSADAAPGFSEVRTTLEEIFAQVDTIVRSRRPAAPSQSQGVQAGAGGVPGFLLPGGISYGGASGNGGGDSWDQAEAMVRAGKVESGLAAMAHLAQRETSGRARYQRKLLLADICLQLNRDRLARTVLEELAEQIDTYRLHEWETSDVVGAVWTRLYRLYKRSDDSERASQLYHRLCRLDPWQALSCSEE